MTSSSILLLGHPRRLSHCPTEKSSDNHIVISNVLSSGHKSPPPRCLTGRRFRQFRKVVFYDKYLVVSRLCMQIFWWSICTISLNSELSTDLSGNFIFRGSFTCRHARHAFTNLSQAFLNPGQSNLCSVLCCTLSIP